jgi:hypothetical protein
MPVVKNCPTLQGALSVPHDVVITYAEGNLKGGLICPIILVIVAMD